MHSIARSNIVNLPTPIITAYFRKAKLLRIATSGLFLIEHAGGQIDLAALQFLRSTVRRFPIYSNGNPFDVVLALHQRRDFSYAPGCPFAPDSVVARQRKIKCPVGVEGARIRIASAFSRVTLSAKSFLRFRMRRSSGVEFTSVCWSRTLFIA
jgi:hypothetical protein